MSRFFKSVAAAGRSVGRMTSAQPTTTISALLAAAADRAVPVVRGVRDDQLEAPTPCADYTVRDLLNHLFHIVIGFTVRAAKQEFDFRTAPDHLQPGWRDRFPEVAARLVRAWAAPGAEEGTSGPLNMPAATVGRLALLDLTIHPWDLARATGQDDRLEPEFCAALVAGMEPIEDAMRSSGQYGPRVAVPEDADAQTKMLGFIGRDPAWTPA